MRLTRLEKKAILKKLKIPLDDWVSPKVEIRRSSLGGEGMFAKEPIKKGETVIIWGGTPGTLFTEEDLKKGLARKGSVSAIDEGLYLGGDIKVSSEKTDFTNHFCDSNLWMKNAVTLIARKNIKAGEELTADYALWQADEGWIAKWKCKCGSKFCRGRITGKDWRRKDVQERYKDHFSPFINKRINKLLRK